MDAYEFDCMNPEDRWEYFFEYGIYQNSVTKGSIDYFLFRHKNEKHIYMELMMPKETTIQEVRIIGGGEALTKYEFGNGERPEPPWK